VQGGARVDGVDGARGEGQARDVGAHGDDGGRWQGAVFFDVVFWLRGVVVVVVEVV
jgi:hypothetical protein